MNKFKVIVQELVCQPYMVEATSPEDALQRVEHLEGDRLDHEVGVHSVNKMDTWKVIQMDIPETEKRNYLAWCKHFSPIFTIISPDGFRNTSTQQTTDLYTEREFLLRASAATCRWRGTSGPRAERFSWAHGHTTISSLESIIKDHIELSLKLTNGNVTAAAKGLRINRNTLYGKMKRLEITK